jgi:Sulfotransferase family
MPRPPRDAWASEPRFQRCDQALRAQYAAAPELRGMHEMSAETADECWRLLHQNFASVTFECTARVPGYSRWCAGANLRPAYARYRRNLQLIGADAGARRWVLKDASHLFALDDLVEQFPDACLVQTHRDPLRVIPSVCSLNAGFRRGLERTPDDAALGREQLELWERGIGRTLEFRRRRPDVRCLDVHFAELAADPVGTAQRVLAECGLESAGERELRDWSSANPQGRHGGHRYSAEQFALDPGELRERFADYVATFGVEPE